ncbi:MAG: hypothetical protein LBV45_07150 [Xanthomonadaceae bacterium]|nr:hypothetical protein [Xanthomonadaceae bacterium]
MFSPFAADISRGAPSLRAQAQAPPRRNDLPPRPATMNTDRFERAGRHGMGFYRYS